MKPVGHAFAVRPAAHVELAVGRHAEVGAEVAGAVEGDGRIGRPLHHDAGWCRRGEVDAVVVKRVIGAVGKVVPPLAVTRPLKLPAPAPRAPPTSKPPDGIR